MLLVDAAVQQQLLLYQRSPCTMPDTATAAAAHSQGEPDTHAHVVLGLLMCAKLSAPAQVDLSWCVSQHEASPQAECAVQGGVHASQPTAGSGSVPHSVPHSAPVSAAELPSLQEPGSKSLRESK